MKNLPCGRTTEHILSKLDDAPDLHELECRWCHMERRRLQDQSRSIVEKLRNHRPPVENADIAQGVLSRISRLRPMQRMWEAASPNRDEIIRISSSEIIVRIREQFSRSVNTQLNYAEVKATDARIPHVQWTVRCTVSMLTQASVEQIEQEILNYVQAGLKSQLRIERLTVEITVEDVHGEVVGYTEVAT